MLYLAPLNARIRCSRAPSVEDRIFVNSHFSGYRVGIFFLFSLFVLFVRWWTSLNVSFRHLSRQRLRRGGKEGGG